MVVAKGEKGNVTYLIAILIKFISPDSSCHS